MHLYLLNKIRRKNIELQEPRTRIHTVFYVISGIEARYFMSYEMPLIKYILEEMKIPIYFLITKLYKDKNKKEVIPFLLEI